MTDDQSRPTDEQHQDAESETQEVPEGDRAGLEEASGEAASSETSETPKESRNASGETASSEAREPEADRVSEDVTGEAANDEAESDPASDDAEVVADDAATDDFDSDGSDSETAPETTTDSDDATADAPESDNSDADASDAADAPTDAPPEVDLPDDVRKYERFKKMDGAQYDRVNEFLRERTYVTAREWAIARLCADFRTETGVEMTKIGENLPELVPFMTDTYTPQAVNQARSSFEGKVRKAGATFLYGAMSGFFTAEELDDMMYEVTEVAKFLLEVEGVDLTVDEELEAEDRISGVMREVQSASEDLRRDELECPNCGHEMEAADDHDHDVEADD